ncbi:metal/formaldehyde-sensitive transcriptional repressor [Phyllobacterium sp. LjRoot231]|uniref:metal/formaldehyde-sensitive transcriptional repressor n=1 Tax=Phyllobacterium sp. LjRoot231 TaxID=3342289 RepID=UPI003ECCDD07
MSHTTKEKAKLLGRIRRLKGQMEAVERALDAEVPCGDILNLVASVRGAVNGLMGELIEDHIRIHVVDPDNDEDSDRAQGAAELIDVVRKYLK